MTASHRELNWAVEETAKARKETKTAEIVSHVNASGCVEIKFPSQFPLHIPKH